MTTISLQSGPFAMRFGHRFGFAHHGKAWGERPDSTFARSRRFAARFGQQGRCAKQMQNAGHHAANLPRRDRALCAFPRTVDGQAELFAQQQLIASTRHDPTPAFHLFRCAQVSLFPEQVLFEKAIAMLLREALAIPGAHLLQRHLLSACPDEPTFAWSRLLSRAASRCTRITLTS